MQKLVIFLLIFLVCGCSGKHCIKLGGSIPGDYAGGENIPIDTEYCWDFGESKAAGVDVLKSDSGERLYAITNADVDKINALIEGKQDAIAAKAVSETETPLAKIKRLMAIIRAKK